MSSFSRIEQSQMSPAPVSSNLKYGGYNLMDVEDYEKIGYGKLGLDKIWTRVFPKSYGIM